MYQIEHIYEADFGCEERLPGAPFMCLVELKKAEQGKKEKGIRVLSGMAIALTSKEEVSETKKGDVLDAASDAARAAGRVPENKALDQMEATCLLEIPDDLAVKLGLAEGMEISDSLFEHLKKTHEHRDFFKSKRYFEFVADPISDEVFDRMKGKSYGEGCFITRDQLRYLHVLHTDYDRQTHTGEMVCNKEIAKELIEIFRYLYAADYPIEKMRLIDDYDADDERSMGDNNSSAFCFRVVAGTDHLSRHAYGMAVDINPLYNPYVKPEGFTPLNAGDYVDRSKDIPYKIAREDDDYCLKLFEAYGYFWGGEWGDVHDYQHFEK